MRHTLLGLMAVTLLCVGVTFAQDRGGGEGERPDRGDRGEGRQRMDPAEMRGRMMDAMKERLGATDEEWGVIQPKLQKVMEAQRDARAGGMGGMMGRGGDRGGDREGRGDRQQDQSPVAKAAAELGKTLQDESANPDEIKQKLQTLRDARASAEKQLETAQEDLKGVLTERQEAMLVVAGMLA